MHAASQCSSLNSVLLSSQIRNVASLSEPEIVGDVVAHNISKDEKTVFRREKFQIKFDSVYEDVLKSKKV
jgi:hypothetical protein